MVGSMSVFSRPMGSPPPSPVRTQEGFSQGCSFAAAGYVVLGTLCTHTAQTGEIEWVVEHSGLTALPSEFVFTDDCRYIERSEEGIARKVHAAHTAAQHNCKVNNRAKQEDTLIELRDHGQLQRVGGHINVQGTVTVASQAFPGVVGIPIQPSSYLPGLVPKIHKKTKKRTAFVFRYCPPFQLAHRCLHAYVVASIIPPRATEQLQPQ